MTDLRKAAEMALEALEDLDGLDTETECVTIYVTDEIEALRQALAQPEQANPIDTYERAYYEGKRAGIAESEAIKTQSEQEPVANEVQLNIIRRWPDGFANQLEHVWKDLIGFIPNYKLLDLQQLLAEFGFTMKIYDGEAPTISEPVENLEPVAWRWLYNGKPDSDKCFDGKGPDADVVLRAANAKFPRTVQYFYTAPPKREWVGLTDEEIKTIWDKTPMTLNAYGVFARSIEAELKEKNIG